MFKSILSSVFILTGIMFLAHVANADSVKVLYLGNSHTFYNNLPQLTYDLALSNGDTIIFESNTPGGCTLGHPENGHLYNPVSLELIGSLDWDYVILQEHSLFGVIEYYRDTYMYPGASSLDSLIKLNNECAETIIQLIWGKKNGGEHCINSHCSIDFVDFSHMQDSLTAEYLRLADTLSCTVAPTGEAWKLVIESSDVVELFSPDESHPSLAGSYLAACVYYAVLFQKSPAGLSFTGGLESTTALFLQEVADEIVFGDPSLWNINGNNPIAGFETMQIANTVAFTDTSVNADYFQWDFGDGTTDTVQNPTHTYSALGTYIITQEASTLCHAAVAIDTVVVDLINATEPLNSSEDISVIPYNAFGKFRVFSETSNIHQIKIYGLEGRMMFSENFNGISEYLLNMNNLPSGFYMLVVYTDVRIRTLKIVHR